MKFDILSARAMLDADRWDRMVDALPVKYRDIHFTSAYGLVQEKNGGEALLAVGSHEDEFVVQPFLKRPVPYSNNHFDLCSPYGYGGPVSNVVGFTSSWAKAFESAMHEWCDKENIVSEFCYMHPLMLDHQRGLTAEVPAEFIKDVVVINLRYPLFVQDVARRVRRGIKKANDIHAAFVECSDRVSRYAFHELYVDSMQRKDAARRWHFSAEYLAAHFDELGARLFMTAGDGGVRMLIVIGMRASISANNGTAYAHLLASNGEALNSGLDDLLYFKVAEILRDDGYERFHLGGGLTRAADDSLLAYKSGFRGLHYKLASYSRIFDSAVYSDLSAVHRAAEIYERGRESESKFFPVYRREFI